MDLGFKPDNLRVILTTGADFKATLELQSGTYGTGVLSLKFGNGTTWTAAMTSTKATFMQAKSAADLIPHKMSARLNYTDGSVTQTWAVGEVIRVA